MLALRKTILGIEDGFPNNTSWRFVDAGFEFVDDLDPWATDIDELYNISGLNGDMQIDFIAVKTGDVDGNVEANVKAGEFIEVRSSKELIQSFTDIELEKGRTYKVSVKGTEDLEISGLQQTMWIEGLEIESIVPGSLNIGNNNVPIWTN